ncbi:hypothetical protein LSPH24S_09885 [Lysinibacillus sphaericus]
MANKNRSSNKLQVPGVQEAVNQMKYEIAQEFGVQLGQMLLLARTVP